MPRGMACIFPRRCQGRKFVLGIDSYPGLPVSKLGMCSQALEIAQAELLLIYKNKNWSLSPAWTENCEANTDTPTKAVH